MTIKRLIQEMAKLKGQTGGSDTEGIYDINKLYRHIAKRKIPAQSIKLSKLGEFKKPEKYYKGWMDRPEDTERVKKAKMFPTIVVRSGRGKKREHWIYDGNHRAWKAHQRGDVSIRAHIIPKHKLPKSALDPEWVANQKAKVRK